MVKAYQFIFLVLCAPNLGLRKKVNRASESAAVIESQNVTANGTSTMSCLDHFTCGTCVVSNCEWCNRECKFPNGDEYNGEGCPTRNDVITDINNCPPGDDEFWPGMDYPARWFLSRDEVTRAMGGVDRRLSQIQTFTFGNRVTFLPTGQKVFEKFYDDIILAGAGDFVLVANFDSSHMVPLKLVARGGVPERRRVMDEVQAAMTRGAYARFLLWARPSSLTEIRDFQRRMSTWKAAALALNATGPVGLLSEVLCDWRFSFTRFGSIHQKFSIVQHSNRLNAMVGGVDFGFNRWDTESHNDGGAAIRSTHFNAEGAHDGWIDRHVHVVGPAARDLANSFAQRWNQEVGPHRISSATPPPQDMMLRPEGTFGRDIVQVLRTYPHSYRNGANLFRKRQPQFVPQGELTYLDAYVKATNMAKHSIYIEDQYGIFQYELFVVLSKALARGVQLVVLYARASAVDDIGGKQSRYEMWRPMMEAWPDQIKLFVWQTDVFVHSKMWIIDDIWMAVGSANINYRSFTHDPEIGIAAVGTEPWTNPENRQVSKLAFDTRVACWAELAGFGGGTPWATLADRIRGIAQLTFAQGIQELLGDHSNVEEVEFLQEGRLYGKARLLDPDGRVNAWL